MRNKSILRAGLLVALAGAAGVFATDAFAQTPVVPNRIAQQVVIGGLRVDAAYVLAAGGSIQSFSCPAPQQYVTPDGASQGWACFDAASNTWILSSLPPQQQAPTPPPAPVVVQPVIQQPVYAYPYAVVQPRIIYAAPVYPRVFYSSPSVAIGVASINAAGRIAAAVIENSRFSRFDRRDVRIFDSRGHRR